MEAPIFIFSLPRSGSTLLQRTLMGHKDIFSIAEPWVLLPQVYALKKEGTLSVYSSSTGHTGLMDFIENLPNKSQDYYRELNLFLTRLYGLQCKNNERYFIDKTPRYYLIIDEIVTLFPNAKFIFLFRNPIHVYASIINTWGKGRLSRLFSTYYDLTDGFEKLSEGYRKHKDRSLAIQYEDFVDKPETEVNKILKYLSLDLDKELINKFSNQDTKGQLGDPTGVHKYKTISNEGLDKWKTTFNTLFRKKIVINYLKRIPDSSFQAQGYDKNVLIKEVNDLKTSNNISVFKDLTGFVFSYIYRNNRLHLTFNKNFRWQRKKYLS